MTTPDRPLPPAVEAAHRILARLGALAATDLRELLGAEGFRQPLERLQQLPDRFPGKFSVTRDGLICAAIAEAKCEDDRTEDPRDCSNWYVPNPARVGQARVAVLDIETTGLNRSEDFVSEIALVRLDGTVLTDVAVATPNDNSRPAVSLADALATLTTALQEVDLVIGHNLLAFDLPFIREAGKSAGLETPPFPPCADTLHLSLLVDVAMPNRQLADLTQRHGIVNDEPHHALSDAYATAAVARALLAEVDMDNPSWPLAIGVLETHGNPLAMLLPSLPSAPDIATLTRKPDSLLVPSADASADAWSATRDNFPVLREKRNLKTRPAQQEMAHAVSQVLDAGGRLAVEAPTGTGKSLAYLIPALGRASRPRQPVVIATATKALQGQLRDEAQRLQEENLLTAPFRQIQGVGNYVCARELEDALPEKDISGLAAAVAIRTIAESPTGTWDDVTDEVIRRPDSRYARTRARLRTTAAGCDRTACERAAVCPLMQQIKDLDKAPGVLSVNHALIASWVKVNKQGGRAPGDVLDRDRADLVFDEAHALEDSLTAAWTERVDAIELEILVNVLSRRSRLLRHIRSKAGGKPVVTDAIEAVTAAAAQIPPRGWRIGPGD